MKQLITPQKNGFMQTYDSARRSTALNSSVKQPIRGKKETKAILRDTVYHKNLKVS